MPKTKSIFILWPVAVLLNNPLTCVDSPRVEIDLITAGGWRVDRLEVVPARGSPGGAPLVEPEGEVVQGRAEDTVAATPERQARTRRRRPTGAARVIRWSKYVA